MDSLTEIANEGGTVGAVGGKATQIVATPQPTLSVVPTTTTTTTPSTTVSSTLSFSSTASSATQAAAAPLADRQETR